MIAVIFDKDNYIKSYSAKFRTPESVVVDLIPDEKDLEKLQCYQFTNGEFILDVEKWAKIEADRAEAAKLAEISHKISERKAKLAESDFYILKLIESALEKMLALLKINLPDDYNEVSEERKTLRDQINAFEKDLIEKSEG